MRHRRLAGRPGAAGRARAEGRQAGRDPGRGARARAGGQPAQRPERHHEGIAAHHAIAHVELGGRSYNFLVVVPPGAYLFTDKYGKRFANEYMQAMSRHDFYYLLVQYDPTTNDYPRNPCYWFFDERRMKIGAPADGPASRVATNCASRVLPMAWLKKKGFIFRIAMSTSGKCMSAARGNGLPTRRNPSWRI